MDKNVQSVADTTRKQSILREEDLEDEQDSLEYEEDCYYNYATELENQDYEPCWPDDEATFTIGDEDDDDVEESCSVETEFFKARHKRNGVRVVFQDLSKPCLARVSSPKNYRRFLQLVKAEEVAADASPDSGINELHGMTPEEQEQQRQRWQEELVKVEDDIQTLRHVLASKVKHAQELKRKLGITVWREFQDDMSQGIKNVKESNVYHNVEEKLSQVKSAVTENPIYQNVEEKLSTVKNAVTDTPIFQKTESVFKTTAEKTTSILGGLGSSVTSKLGQIKNSESFRSFEEKVGSAYENVKTKVVTSRSNSMQSFDEALREAEGNRRSSAASATSPTIPEDKPLS